MKIFDCTKELKDHKQQTRELEDIEGLGLHRVGKDLKTGVDLGSTGYDIAEAFLGRNKNFLEVAKVTNYQNAYSFYIGKAGEIWQALPLTEIGWHARSHSKTYIGIGVIGDFRVEQPTEKQLEALNGLCAELSLAFLAAYNKKLDIKGHGELQGGDKAPGRAGACPGKNLSIKDIRKAVEQDIKLYKQSHFAFTGLVI